MYRSVSVVGVLAFILITAGCHKQDSPMNSHPEAVKDYQNLSTYLQSRGIQVESARVITAACFSAPHAWEMAVSGGRIKVKASH
jgi:hypothetical protein